MSNKTRTLSEHSRRTIAILRDHDSGLATVRLAQKYSVSYRWLVGLLHRHDRLPLGDPPRLSLAAGRKLRSAKVMQIAA